MTYTHPPQVEDYVQFLTKHNIDPTKIQALAADFADYCTGFDLAYCSVDDANDGVRKLREVAANPYMTAGHSNVIRLFGEDKWLLVANPDNPTYTLKVNRVDVLTTTDQAAAIAAYNQAEPQSYLLIKPELREENRPPHKEDALSRVIDELRRQTRSH